MSFTKSQNWFQWWPLVSHNVISRRSYVLVKLVGSQEMSFGFLFSRHVIARHLRTGLPRLSQRWVHLNGCLRSNTGALPSGGGSYDGDGKTTVTIVNKDVTGYLLVDSYSSTGFRLSNQLFAYGPIALFPSTVLQWDVKDVEDITEKSLSLFTILEPRLELLVIGVGDDEDSKASTAVNRRIRSILMQKKINCEILPTKHAVSTYNYLCVDHRVCAGAFIPPLKPDIDKGQDPFLMGRNTRFISQTGSVFG